jgi:hypothetical protein
MDRSQINYFMVADDLAESRQYSIKFAKCMFSAKFTRDEGYIANGSFQ